MRFKILAVLLTASALHAHHSVTAEYDPARPFDIEGTVTRLEWANPHSHLYLDAKDGKKWTFELGPPVTLMRLGWQKDSIKPGDRVRVAGYSSKDGSPTGNGRRITFADGRQLRSRNGTAKDPDKQ